MDVAVLKGLRILYVEDEAEVRRSVKEAIAPFVTEIIEASDGEEGLRIFSQTPEAFDVIITDILMPRMGGIEMVEKIRNLDREIPVIYTTAFDDSLYLRQTIQHNVTAYILKPIDIEALLEAIGKAAVVIENRQLRFKLQNINQELERKVQDKTYQLLEKNRELFRQLYTDTLTGLPNRKALREVLSDTPAVAVILVDIDAFRTYNETYGEQVGNEILRVFASFLDLFARERHFQVYRIGGDVFALFNPECSDLDECERVAQELLDACRQKEIVLKKYPLHFHIGLSIGIASDPEKPIEKASMALKRAKVTQKHLMIYAPEFSYDQEYQHDMHWFEMIRKAIEEDRVRIYMQPIVDKEGRIVKYEALVRIVTEDRVYTAGDFLDVAKKMKLYPELSHIIFSKAFELARAKNHPLSVNLTIENIEDEEFSQWLIENLRLFGVEGLLTFEILESENIRDYERVIAYMNQMKKLGCKVAIDDFGSGYSNFVYLRKLNPDYIKIDGSLVQNIDKDHNAETIIHSINHFAHSLGIKTIAEFVHSKEVFEKLKTIGVDYFQGYYFSRPLPPEAIGEISCVS